MIRESKYIIRRVIIGVFITIILSFISSCEVHAETLNISDNSKFNNKNIPVWYDISPYRDILFSYEDWRLYSGDPYNANFGYIDVCIYGGVTVNNNNADCSDGCLNNINLYDTGINCKIEYSNQVNTSGRRYFIFFNIKKWGMKNADTLPYFQDYLTFVRTTGYDPILDFNMVFLSNEDLYVQYASNNRIQELIEQSNQSISNSTQSIINNQNQLNQNVINNNNSNTNSIINNQNQNKQDIIDNQNSNTDKQIESQNVCSKYDKNAIELEKKYLTSNGTEKSSSSPQYGISKYIKINSTSKIKVLVKYNETDYACFYNINKQLISCIKQQRYNTGDFYPIPENASYFRYTLVTNLNIPQLEICSNGNQAMNDTINETNDTLKDNTVDDPSGEFEDFKGMLADNGVITELITLPISLFTNILNSINGSCSQFVLGELMGTNLTIPCINISEYLGSFLWNVIDILFSGIFVYTISKKMIQVFENMTSMRESDDLS